MNIIIISEYESRELYVIEQIQKKYPRAIVIQPIHQAGERKTSLKPDFSKTGNRIRWKIQRSLWDRRLYPRKSFPKIYNKQFILMDKLNSDEGVEYIRRLKPDVLLTCRAPILNEDIIAIPKLAAVNVHYGIAPFYRGNHTLFWPLLLGDYDRLGGCIHYLAQGIDTGHILAEVYPALHSADGEITVDIKTTKLLAAAVLALLQELESGNIPKGIPQQTKGRNFNNKERSFLKSLQFLARHSLYISRPPRREAKVRYFFQPLHSHAQNRG